MTPRRKRYLTPPESPRTVGFWRKKVTASGRTLYTPNRGRTMRRIAAQTAGAAIGYIQGNVPGIVEGAHYAGKAFDYFHPEEEVAEVRGKSFTQNNNSMYAGKMNRPKPYDQSIDSKILKEGYLIQQEIHGKLSDAYCALIQHASWNSAIMARCFAGALLRKLFKKAGIEITDRLGTLPLFSVTDGSGFRIEYITMNPSTNVASSFTFDTIATSTLDNLLVATAGSFQIQIQNYLDAAVVAMPYKLILYSHDNNVAAVNYRMASSIDIPNEVAHFHFSSVLKLQNRTQADLAGTGDLNVERLDSQPIKATTYAFNGDPRLKNVWAGSGQVNWQGITVSGLKLFGSATFPGDTSFENAPNVAMFANCKKKTTTIFQPGQMKTTYCKYDLKGKIVNILPKQRLESSTGGIITGVKCQTEIVAFEEILRTAGTNPIVIQYERQLKIGCILKTKKDNFALQPNLLTTEFNWP